MAKSKAIIKIEPATAKVPPANPNVLPTENCLILILLICYLGIVLVPPSFARTISVSFFETN